MPFSQFWEALSVPEFVFHLPDPGGPSRRCPAGAVAKPVPWEETQAESSDGEGQSAVPTSVPATVPPQCPPQCRPGAMPPTPLKCGLVLTRAGCLLLFPLLASLTGEVRSWAAPGSPIKSLVSWGHFSLNCLAPGHLVPGLILHPALPPPPPPSCFGVSCSLLWSQRLHDSQ